MGNQGEVRLNGRESQFVWGLFGELEFQIFPACDERIDGGLSCFHLGERRLEADRVDDDGGVLEEGFPVGQESFRFRDALLDGGVVTGIEVGELLFCDGGLR